MPSIKLPADPRIAALKNVREAMTRVQRLLPATPRAPQSSTMAGQCFQRVSAILARKGSAR
jgi:hypothetical protein